MSVTRSGVLKTIFAASFFGALLIGGTAAAQKVVKEPNGFLVPQPANPTEVACCGTSRGFPASALELSGLFAYRNEMIDWEADAKTGPGVFSPLCGFTGTLVLRGGDCKLDFGWYNVTPGSSTPPADSEIYTLIPNTDPDVYGPPGMNVDFCPLAGVSTQTQNNNRCQIKAFAADNIRSDARYKGGLVGFALRGNPTSICKETHYSQNQLHAQCTSCTPAAPWIMALQYQSTVSPDAFYIAFEDQKAGEFGAGKANDGDFNDFVFFISGVTCEGGGQPCDASATNPALKGACALGKTGCSATADGAAACMPVVQPSGEKCDNLDNDCNGLVDDGNGLCRVGEVCDKGSCVSACNTGEFACPVSLVCAASGYCVDPLCKDVTCEAGQVCRSGKCVGGCGGVVCPTNQECQLGRCVDLCKGVTCGDNQVCERGLCISSCSCRPCIEGKTCAKDGRCVDTACKDKTCGAGTFCAAGECKDACSGAVVCPGGAACTNGECGDPIPGVIEPGGAGGPSIPGSAGGGIVVNPGSGTGGTGSGSGGTGNPGGAGRSGSAESGCSCSTVPAAGGSGWLAFGLLVAGVAVARRRRVAQRAS